MIAKLYTRKIVVRYVGSIPEDTMPVEVITQLLDAKIGSKEYFHFTINVSYDLSKRYAPDYSKRTSDVHSKNNMALHVPTSITFEYGSIHGRQKLPEKSKLVKALETIMDIESITVE